MLQVHLSDQQFNLISMAQFKTTVTPVHQQWCYFSLTLATDIDILCKKFNPVRQQWSYFCLAQAIDGIIQLFLMLSSDKKGKN